MCNDCLHKFHTFFKKIDFYLNSNGVHFENSYIYIYIYVNMNVTLECLIFAFNKIKIRIKFSIIQNSTLK